MKSLISIKHSASRARLLLLILAGTPTPYAISQDQRCDNPRIIISSATKAGSFYSDDFTITGRIRGVGIKEAGIYVAGQLLNTLPIEVHHQKLINNRFQITVDASEEPEIRVTTNSGQTVVEKIDVLDYRS